jgi:hypothetical protein
MTPLATVLHSRKTGVVHGALEARLGSALCEGDDLHPAASVAKMAGGHPLTDDDRWPWGGPLPMGWQPIGSAIPERCGAVNPFGLSVFRGWPAVLEQRRARCGVNTQRPEREARGRTVLRPCRGRRTLCSPARRLCSCGGRLLDLLRQRGLKTGTVMQLDLLIGASWQDSIARFLSSLQERTASTRCLISNVAQQTVPPCTGRRLAISGIERKITREETPRVDEINICLYDDDRPRCRQGGGRGMRPDAVRRVGRSRGDFCQVLLAWLLRLPCRCPSGRVGRCERLRPPLVIGLPVGSRRRTLVCVRLPARDFAPR